MCRLDPFSQRYFLAVCQYRPFRTAKVPVDDLKEEIVAFVAERVQEIGAEVSELKWGWRQTTGFRLDISIRPGNAG